MSAGLRAALRREAASARDYQVYERSLATARRTRRRQAAGWLAAVAAVALAVPVTGQPLPAAPADGTAPVALPDRIGRPAIGSLHATDRPRLGAASVLFSGTGSRFRPLFDEPDTYALVGARDERYRTLHAGLVGDGAALLSPDGRTVATWAELIDLGTGDARPLPGGGGTPLAWSPDGTRLVLLGDRLRIADLRTGAGTDLAAPGPLSSAAWSPDGTRLAYESDRDIVVADAAGRRLSAFTPPDGGMLAGKGAWTPDSRAVALVAAEPERWAPRWFEPATGREVPGPDLPPVPGRITTGELLGWRADGTALLFAYGAARPDDPSSATPARLLALTPGAGTAADAMALPAEVTVLDLADQALRSGRTRPGEPPGTFGGRAGWWLAGSLLAAAAAVALRRRRRARGRRRRLVAVPWGTTHGPLS